MLEGIESYTEVRGLMGEEGEKGKGGRIEDNDEGGGECGF